MKRTIVRTARLGIGALLILAGIVAGFLPIVQGWVLILAGLTVMAPESRRAHRLLEWVKERLAIRKHKDARDAAATGGCDGAMTTSDSTPSVRPGASGHGPLPQ